MLLYPQKNLSLAVFPASHKELAVNYLWSIFMAAKKVKLILDLFQSYEFSKVSLLNTVFKFIGHLIIKRWFQVWIVKTSIDGIQNLSVPKGVIILF